MIVKHRKVVALWVVLVSAFVAGAKFAAEPPAPPKVSTFAPAGDLLAQVEYYKKRMKDAVASEADFDEAKQARVKKDANTLAVLASAFGHARRRQPTEEVGRRRRCSRARP